MAAREISKRGKWPKWDKSCLQMGKLCTATGNLI